MTRRMFSPLSAARLSAAGTLFFIFLFFSACGKKADPVLPVQVAPEHVKKLQAVVRPQSIVLLWKAPKKNTDDSPLRDLAGFKILRAEAPFEKACLSCPRDYVEIFDYEYTGARGRAPSQKWWVYYDRAVKFGNIYTYKIHCYNQKDTLGPSSATLNVYCDVPPGPPSGFSAKRIYRTVRLEWEPPTLQADGKPAEDIAGFNVYRAIKAGEYEQFPFNKEIINETVFEDIPQKDDIVYYYTVRALRKVKDTLIESEPSEQIAVPYMDIKPSGIPQALTAIPTDEGILLKWMPKTEKDFAGFNLYRKPLGEDGFVKLNKKLITHNSWLDKDVKFRKKYIYGVTSVDRSVQSNESVMSQTVVIFYILK